MQIYINKAHILSEINNFKIVTNPLIEHYLSVIRDKKSSQEIFRNAVKKVSYALIYEASAFLPLKEKEIETPVQKTIVKTFDESNQVILAPILRAGMIFCQSAFEMLPFANVHHIGMYRNEQTLEPVWYYDKNQPILKDKSKVYVIILDPMLATGNSGNDAINNFISKGILEENITFMSLISSPEGVCNMHKKFPKVRIITSAYDKGLNTKGYIVPGLGDIGDRIYNT